MERLGSLQGGSVLEGDGSEQLIVGEIVSCVASMVPMIDQRNEKVSVSADDLDYKLIRLIEANPKMSQRDVARELGISLGNVNYCLKALIQKGWIKARNFKNSQNKSAYMYLLTPRGIEHKAGLTVRFLQAKLLEYEALRTEIEKLRSEASQIQKSSNSGQ